LFYKLSLNDQPSFTTTGNPATVNEDAGAITISNWATFNPGSANEASQTATYTISNISNPGLFAAIPTVNSSGTLTYTPATDANGTSTFDVVVQDNGGTANGGVDTSSVQPFTITVTPVNDAPSFSNAGNQTLTSWTNTVQTVSNWANTFVFGPTSENSQAVADFLVNVTAGNDLFTALPDIANDGTLTYTPNGKPGTATVQVQLKDDGGILNGGVDTSSAATFNIIIPPPTVELTTNTTTATEAGTTAITLTATAQGAVSGNQTLNLALTGTASNSDFSGTIPAQITIANGSNTGQVTLTIANDLIAEDSETATLTISNPSSGIQLGTTTAQTITITDNDTAGYLITPISGDTSEFGSLATFDIHLTSQPTADVTLNFTSDNPAEGTVTPSITFNSSNWNQYQTITITGVNDFVADGDIPYNITGTAISSDPKYNNNNPTNVAVINTDNDSPGVTITPSGGTTQLTEGSITDTYTIALNTLPTGNVQITATADAQTQVSLDGVNFAASQTLTFTSVNGITPQTVTVRAIDDKTTENIHSGSITNAITNSADANYPTTMALDGITANITDNDISYSLTGGSPTITEGNSGTQQITYNITRTGALNETSTVDFNFSGTATNIADYKLVSVTGTGVSTTNSTITFAPNATSATITVEVVGDQIDEDDESLIFSLVNPTATGTATVTGSPATTTITDDYTAGFTITPTSLTTTEAAGTATFTVALNTQPTADVKINLSSDNTAEGILDKPSLTFNAANWNSPQTVTVTGVDDFGDDGDIAYNIITSAATSTDAKYNGINPVDVAVTNTDNDTAGVALSSTNVAAYEGGAGGSYTAVLTSKPTAPVTVNFSGGSQINPLAALTFDSNNWNVPQPVIITAIDDNIAEGLATEIISHTVTSADAKYNGVNVGTVTATITDNDTAAAPVVQPLGRMDLRESGGEDVYKLFLTTQPTATVNVAIVTDGQTTANVPYVTFTPSDWNLPQLVRVSAVDDNVVEGTHTSNISFVASSVDGVYQGLPISGITVNIADNDNVGLVESLPTPGSRMGTAADDKIVGSAGDDVINARGGNNALDGGAGNDVLSGGSGADYITGGAGLDLLFGGQGEDYLDGGNDEDVIFAGMGSDRVFGGNGNDKLFGEQGDDYLFGGAGVDTVTGGLGRDAFAIGNGMGGMTVEMADVITDFVPGEDVFDLIPSLGFGDLSLVQNGGDVVIQNRVTGEFLARVQGVDVASLTQADFV